ncbi:nucleotide-binding universal stress UspA family protein [Cerasibacillus quisquiliarum]|uniref:Universal stress protein n=1 Tax=Cerasibacillus quisquiliarum TaxID=227865 RepID=A0A511V2I2_9BACI|nr:universal stress protein [Cerasibacillus quisquiliarum]MBB5147379.1 nucleotide-binding universal stress UspA family protein [Cerasibacillus quisquiliarum]GEN32261.1 universal stress protein [Cerasibacillus quisquiliarum]
MALYKKILVAVDGSDEAKKAFNKAVNIAKKNEATLMITNVIDSRSFAMVEAYDRTLGERAEAQANELIDVYVEEAKKAGVTKVIKNVAYGSPRVKIPKDIAKEFEADLLVCGATGLSAVERFLIGSVSESIVRFAPCSVLVVR